MSCVNCTPGFTVSCMCVMNMMSKTIRDLLQHFFENSTRFLRLNYIITDLSSCTHMFSQKYITHHILVKLHKYVVENQIKIF